MGLMKVLDKFRTKNGAAEPGNGGESGKKMKKARSIVRVAPKKTDPNYMKSTTSSDKRKEEKNHAGIDSSAPPAAITKTPKVSLPAARVLVKNSSLKKLRASAKKNAGKILQSKQGSRDILPPAIKDSKAPKPVDQEKHEAAPAAACPYSYCSLHGHKHGAVPSLKRILSQKVQKSMDLRGYSSIEKKGGKEIELVEDVVNELFLEIHTKLQEKRSKEDKLGDQSDAGLFQDSCSVASFEDCGDKNSELSMEEIQVINQFLEYVKKEYQEEAGIEASAYQTSSEFQNATFADLPRSPNGSEDRVWAAPEASVCGERPKNVEADPINFAPENHFEDDAFHPQQLNTDSSHDMYTELNNKPKIKHTRSRSRSRSTKNRESVKVFNPRPPRLLEQKAEPEQEQINLKHQTVEERKAAEEWMVDFALRKALRRLTSVRKQKVPHLVAAFETVLPQKV